jgi:hypothetical protein
MQQQQMQQMQQQQLMQMQMQMQQQHMHQLQQQQQQIRPPAPPAAATPQSTRWQPARLANDGSLDMRFGPNKPHDKYKCADGVCRCGFIR